MELEWRNHWTSPEWKPMKATTEPEANAELMRGMPYTEDGTQIRRKDTGQVLNWSPPRNEINFGPF